MDKIRLKNITFYAHHGYYQAERELGQKFEVDIEITTDLSEPALEDDLKKTMDYRKIFQIAKETFEENEFHLIETIAERMATRILNVNNVQAVRIWVRKPHVPLSGLLDYVEVEIYREQHA